MEKIFIKTYGCTHNQSDSEFMAGLLEQEGFKLVDDEASSDLIIINTCTVKDPSEKKFFFELENIKKPVVVAGCIPQSDQNNPKLQNYSLVGVKQIERIAEVVKQTLQGNKVRFLNQSNDQSLNLPRIRKNSLIEIIPISSGCLGQCTFCKTKFARGSLVSFKEEAIIKQARAALNEGVKEIWLTSEDTGAYGLDIKTTLPHLLKELLKINKDYKVRLGMINPEYVIEYVDELVEIYQYKKMFKFIHIPVQSGNDRILKLMKRPYTIKDFRKVVHHMTKLIPTLTISTDIICGFPTETEEEFQDTMNLVKEMKFPVLNISKFYPRPRTLAAKMIPLDTMIKKARSKKLTNLNKTHISNAEWIGWEGEIIVDDVGNEDSFLGRTNSYRQIVVRGKNLFGKHLKVRVVDICRDYFVGSKIE
ncbi:tRNA (N(6)-L-threonylcarbamoyladenosine(37)-C(2))-methylthiotransferase [Candidatus Woesearchaeota archaeon]|nr:tRNA (N(6)-L-threonylcarbamoyladenosine(37)-C(2))-methylthiotransferase [Candidatus Woesearchaeota archaeon]